MGTPKSSTLLHFKSLSGTFILRFREGRLLQSLNRNLLTKFYNYVQHNTHEVRIIKIKTNSATINSVQLPAELLSFGNEWIKKKLKKERNEWIKKEEEEKERKEKKRRRRKKKTQ